MPIITSKLYHFTRLTICNEFSLRRNANTIVKYQLRTRFNLQRHPLGNGQIAHHAVMLIGGQCHILGNHAPQFYGIIHTHLILHAQRLRSIVGSGLKIQPNDAAVGNTLLKLDNDGVGTLLLCISRERIAKVHILRLNIIERSIFILHAR